MLSAIAMAFAVSGGLVLLADASVRVIGAKLERRFTLTAWGTVGVIIVARLTVA